MSSYDTEWRRNNPGARGPSRAERELPRATFGWGGRNLFRLALLVVGVGTGELSTASGGCGWYR